MDEKLFRTLLYQSEGPELDFKRDQYAFRGATDLDKSKLLKDILTFANSWRVGNAHILIGVEELSDGRLNPLGISPGDHIDDASLQQFVNSKTNRQVKFSYEAFHFDGKSFGVITIPKQNRPLYAKRDYGIVKAGEVYFRRGSSCATATPEDLYQMGLDDEKEGRSTPTIHVELADLKRGVTLGTSIRLNTIKHEKHNRRGLPNAGSSDSSPLGRFNLDRVNVDYWRELADYIFVRRTLAPIGFAALNASGELAKNVRIEINQAKETGIIFMEGDDLPKYPVYQGYGFLQNLPSNPLLQRNVPEVRDHHDRWTLLINFGDVQPKATNWATEPVYVAASAPGPYTLAIKVYADNLSQPLDAEIELDFDIDMRPALTIEEIERFDEQYVKELEEKYASGEL